MRPIVLDRCILHALGSGFYLASNPNILIYSSNGCSPNINLPVREAGFIALWYLSYTNTQTLPRVHVACSYYTGNVVCLYLIQPY